MVVDLEKMAAAAAAWWADRLDPMHGYQIKSYLCQPLAEDEIAKFKRVLASEIADSLAEETDIASEHAVVTLEVVDMIHSGILADVAEQTDLSGIIYYLPRANMTVRLGDGTVVVDGEVVWDHRQTQISHRSND